MLSLWEYCDIDDVQIHNLDVISKSLEEIDLSYSVSITQSSGEVECNENNPHRNILRCLHSVEASCGEFIQQLDEILTVLDDISRAHNDVTGRTNDLMTNCESLLERQVYVFS